MYRFLKRLTCGGLTVCGLLSLASLANAQIMLFYDRIAFTAALGGLAARTDDYEAYPPGPLALGDRRGDFLYSFDPAISQPAVVPGGFGGQALGGTPFDVFVGGDTVTLAFAPIAPSKNTRLRAFGADFLYAPSFDTIPADTYRISIGDGKAAGQFIGNLDSIDPGGGSFFLGILANQRSAFTQVNLFSVQTDPAFLVPAYQVDDLIFAAVPEPSALTLFLFGSALLGLSLRRRR
jgi:hypothetical protein